jgi:glutaminase
MLTHSLDLNRQKIREARKINRKKMAEDMLKDKSSQKDENVYQEVFDMLDMADTGDSDSTYIDKIRFLVKSNGLEIHDPRIATSMKHLDDLERQHKDLDFESFKQEFQYCFTMIKRIVYNNFIYSDFDEQFKKAQAIFEEVKAMEDEGTIPDYIPALEDVDPEQFAVSICTVDGQIINLGNFDSRASMHAISGVVSYLIAHEQLHEENLKKYIGTEPSGNQYNDLSLMDSGIPHNPLNCAGSLMSTSLIFQGESNAK